MPEKIFIIFSEISLDKATPVCYHPCIMLEAITIIAKVLLALSCVAFVGAFLYRFVKRPK